MSIVSDYTEVKKLRDKVNELEKKIHVVINNKNVNTYVEGQGFVKSIDTRALHLNRLKLNQTRLILNSIKYKYCLASKRKMLSFLDAYLNSLSDELKYLKTQKTVRTKSGYILDYRKIYNLEALITSEQVAYIGKLELRFRILKEFWKSMRKNGKILLMFLVMFIFSPIISGIIVSFPSVTWLQTDNDWIGFWGSYIGGNIGAIIGGFVAYNVAKRGFEVQKELDRKSHISKLKVEKISEFLSCILTLNQKITLHKAYLEKTYNIFQELFAKQKSSNKVNLDVDIFNLIKAKDTIRDNRKTIYNQLETYQNLHQLISYLISKHGDQIQTVNTKILSSLQFTDKFEGLFEFYSDKNISKNINIDFSAFDKALNEFITIFDDVDYNIYILEVALKNEIAKELQLQEIKVIDSDSYKDQRKSRD